MPAVMISAFENLEVKGSRRGRLALCRTRTLDGSFPNSSFRRLDNAGGEGNNAATINGAHQPLHRKEKKNVRFADDSKWERHIVEPMVAEKGAMKDFWVLPDELKEIKKEGFLACKEAIRSGLAALLTEIYGTGNERDTQDRLNYWCRMASPCRGLERFANEELSKRRTFYRKRAIVSVIEAQKQLKNETGIDTANVLRRLSEAYTEHAREYAAQLGTADFHAIQSLKAPPPPPPPPIPTSGSVASPGRTA